MILYPDFDKIKELCRKKIELSYPKYGNSWTNQQSPPHFWHHRFMEEGKEVLFAVNLDKKLLQGEIIDCINILAMWHQSLEA